MAENPYKGATKVNQYFLNGSDDTTLATAVAAGSNVTITFDSINPDASSRKVSALGQCVLIIEITSTSGTQNVVISGRNVYGSTHSQSAADKWAIKTVSATTTPAVFTTQVHITNPDDYDPNSTGLIIHIDPASADVTYRGRVLRI